MRGLQKAFSSFDNNNSGTIKSKSLGNVLRWEDIFVKTKQYFIFFISRTLGMNPTEAELQVLFKNFESKIKLLYCLLKQNNVDKLGESLLKQLTLYLFYFLSTPSLASAQINSGVRLNFIWPSCQDVRLNDRYSQSSSLDFLVFQPRRRNIFQ